MDLKCYKERNKIILNNIKNNSLTEKSWFACDGDIFKVIILL